MKQLLLAALSLCFVSLAQAEPIEVKVAAYEFPPYYSDTMPQHLAGEVTAALNALQSDYYFTLERIAPNARYTALSEDGCCDIILFEDRNWDWSKQAEYPVGATETLLQGTERFVALKHINRDQAFFEVQGLRFGGIVGYHYPFVANEKDKRVLEEQHGIYLTHSHQANLRMLMNGRLDLIMLADEFMQAVMSREEREKLLLAEKPYGVYELQAVVNAKKAISVEVLNGLLQQLRENGTLQAVYQRFNVASEAAEAN